MSSFAKLEILHNINNLVLLFVENSRNYQKKDKIYFSVFFDAEKKLNRKWSFVWKFVFFRCKNN